jgi:hypothetical protein
MHLTLWQSKAQKPNHRGQTGQGQGICHNLRGSAAQRFDRKRSHMLFKPGLPDHLKLTAGLQHRSLLAPSAATHNTGMLSVMFCENLNNHSRFTMLAHGQ